MSPAVAAQAVMRGDRSYAVPPRVTRGEESPRDGEGDREMPLVQPSAPDDTSFQIPEWKNTKSEEFNASTCGIQGEEGARISLNTRCRLFYRSKHVPDALWRTY